MILHIHDKGDPSVGISPTGWHVEAPFDESMEDETKEWFREKIKEVYKEFTDGKIEVAYDYELKYPDDEF